MNTAFFVIATISLFFVVIVQLIKMNITVLKLNKDASLSHNETKEKHAWEFIKGLY